MILEIAKINVKNPEFKPPKSYINTEHIVMANQKSADNMQIVMINSVFDLGISPETFRNSLKLTVNSSCSQDSTVLRTIITRLV